MANRKAGALTSETIYLKRYAYPAVHLQSPPDPSLGLVVVIPSFDESALLGTLESLMQCDRPACAVEIIVVVNHGVNATSEIKQKHHTQVEQVRRWISEHSQDNLCFFVIYKPDLPAKHAGVGLARKIGMDEAVRRLENVNHFPSIIAALDADCSVDRNYLVALADHWSKHPETNGVAIYYEHPWDGLGLHQKNGIIDYELHLRYYVHAQDFAGFPFAFQTVGSSMAVSNKAYQKQGGMNRRKAGEDFYFLQKIFLLGNFHNLNTTRVLPSARASGRVPFGTGKFINDYLNHPDRQITKTYQFEIFRQLKTFLASKAALYHVGMSVLAGLPKPVQHFLDNTGFGEALQKMKTNSSSFKSFEKSFHHWFDGFLLMKFVHFARNHYYPNQNLNDQVKALFEQREIKIESNSTNENLLTRMRNIDRKSGSV